MSTPNIISHPLDKLACALLQFLRYHPPQRVNQNIRNMLLEYLQRDDVDVNEIQSLLFDLEGLFKFLDVAEQEWGQVESNGHPDFNP